jgi:hypothetical protein
MNASRESAAPGNGSNCAGYLATFTTKLLKGDVVLLPEEDQNIPPCVL